MRRPLLMPLLLITVMVASGCGPLTRGMWDDQWTSERSRGGVSTAARVGETSVKIMLTPVTSTGDLLLAIVCDPQVWAMVIKTALHCR